MPMSENTVTQKSLEQAFLNLHKFTADLMRRLKEIEDDEDVPGRHRLTAQVARWDWESRSKSGK